MATQLKEHHQDLLEYVQNINKLGGNEQMAEYQGCYIQQSTEKSIKESIADLHLERFATKADLSAVEYRLDAKIDKVAHRLEVKMEQLERRLEEKINKVAHDLEKFKIYIEKHIDHKFFKHTTITVMAIIINDMAMSDSFKRLLLTIIHSG